MPITPLFKSLPVIRTVVLALLLLFNKTVLLAQCNLPAQLTIPVADRAKSNTYGATVDSFGDFMIVGEYHNDSLGLNNGIVHLYQLTANKWRRIAILTPSDPQEFMLFGFYLSMNASTIAIIGNHYDADGHSREKIYVFEQDSNGKWNSGTESYQIEVSTAEFYQLRSLDLSMNYLAVAFEENYKDNKVSIYKHDPGHFTFVQTIDGPVDVDGINRYFGEHISLTDDLLVVTAAFHKNDPNSFYNYGLVLLYERTGASWTSLPVATLNPSDRSAFINIQFGRDVQISGTSVLVASHQNVANTNSKNTVYVYTRPPGGWSGDLLETSQIQNGENGYQHWDMVTDGDYLFLPNIDWTAVAIHKRTGATWENHTLVQTIVLPVWTGDNWGRSMTVTGSHFVVGLGANGEKLFNDGMMVDYLPDATWENGFIENQQFNETSIDASMDEYGRDVAVNQTWMAVGAAGDDDNGEYGGAVYVYELSPSSWVQKQKITAHDGNPFMFFGNAVALGADHLFVGAKQRHTYHPDGSIAIHETGAVYVYKRTGITWQFDEMIPAPNPKLGGRFGQEITYHNGYIAVSEFNENSTGSLGYVHLYKENATGEWNRIATLTPSDHSITENFGGATAMDDSTIVVGTGGVQFRNDHFMKAYVFKKKGEWQSASEDARLFPEHQLYGDRFGFSVALHGDQIVVGAPGYSDEDFQPEDAFRGTAYVFLKPAGGWTGDIYETAQLWPSNPLRHGEFGISVAIDEDDIYVGSPQNYSVWNVVDNFNSDDGKLHPGTVYHYYKKSGWTTTTQEDRQLHAMQPDVNDLFGTTLVLKDGFLCIGAVLDHNGSGYRSGSVLTFPQAPFITSIGTPCVEDGPVSLYAIPWGGTWNITGYPAQTATTIQLPAGSYSATYAIAGCPPDQAMFNVISSGLAIQDVSPAEIEKCVYESTLLHLISNAPLSNHVWYYNEYAADHYEKIDKAKNAINIRDPGFYYVEINHPICNPHLENFHVVNEPIVDVAIEKPSVICSEEMVQLRATPGGGDWSSPASGTGDIDPSAMPDGQYPITYTFTTDLGCQFTKNEIITIAKLVKPEISKSGSYLCTNEPVTLTVLNKPAGATLTWFNTASPAVSISSAENVTITDAGTYFAMMSNHSCTLPSDNVQLDAKTDSLFVPNVITPNGDLKNEFFEVISEGVADMRIVLFNRYGDRIFSSTDPTFKWDAHNTSSGVYYWYLQYTSCSNQRRELKGYVHVIH